MKRCWLLLLLAACDDGGPSTSPELLFELRQLRGSVEQLAQRKAPPVALDQALAPLQEVMQTLAQDQQDLRTRQLALTGELQRWTQVLGQAAPKGDTADLQARLQKLEQELQAQNQRHQEVQELLRQALEKTSDRLEGFLQKLQAVQPDKAPVDADMQKEHGDKGQTAAGEAPWLQMGGRARAEPWTIALLSGAVVMVAAFAWRYWRAGEVRRAAAVPLEEAGNNTDELWAAAALLSEAVGRLKAVAPAAGEAPQADLSAWLRQLSVPTAPPADDLDDGVFVLDDDVEAPVAAGPSDALPTAEAPVWREVTLDCRRPELVAGVVEAALCGDPRVLRRPAPQVQRHGDSVLVRYCLLPDLGDAEATQFRLLLQRLAGS